LLTKPRETEPKAGFEDWPQIVSCNENWDEETIQKRTNFDLNKAAGSSERKYFSLPCFPFKQSSFSHRLCEKLPRGY
jgi:hypothetical protein